jgi:hypothetical protein
MGGSGGSGTNTKLTLTFTNVNTANNISEYTTVANTEKLESVVTSVIKAHIADILTQLTAPAPAVTITVYNSADSLSMLNIFDGINMSQGTSVGTLAIGANGQFNISSGNVCFLNSIGEQCSIYSDADYMNEIGIGTVQVTGNQTFYVMN